MHRGTLPCQVSLLECDNVTYYISPNFTALALE